ncbi:hypothetical protein FF38_02696 [Lucilia cuprina]|uniref:Helicase C-terminal domain-containing protein n=1 Tax=Lucilia cuprina TaxID=7375 RepID=A0A0L0CDB7_LUCCU|nr:putative ATP-dependent RNA helicase PB1A10.06c [Lucilia cuprina]KNC29459.1 hypothetical protein FF38_02696 [Lucilia cuprina]
MKVFDKVPKGHRLCVVATNVAETSLTIPGIRYVIDCGRSKQRDYDLKTGVQKYRVKWVSKASADQRAGRAGRTGPGHCYRLFSSAIFEADFPQFGEPEMLRMPIEGLVLQMKAMGLSKISNFPFPTAIPDSSLQKGLKTLQNIGALDTKEEITKLGEQMSLFPLHPRHAKMLLIANQNQCLPLIIALVATMSVNQALLESNNVPQLDAQADVLQLLSAFAAFSFESTRDLCENLGLRYKQMLEAKSLRDQLANLVAKFYKPDAVTSTTNMLLKPLDVPNSVQVSTIKQIVAAAYIDLIAIRQQLVSPNEESAKIGVKQVTRVPYISSEGPISYLGTTVMRTAPDLVVYQQLNSTETTIRILPLTSVTMHQLALLAQGTALISYSKPLGGAYAPRQLPNGNRQIFVVPHYQNTASNFNGFDLPPQKLVQKRINNKWVNI